MAAWTKPAIVIASGMLALGAGIGVASVASADIPLQRLIRRLRLVVLLHPPVHRRELSDRNGQPTPNRMSVRRH